MDEAQLKREIFEKVKRFYELKHKNRKFVPGVTKIGYAGRVFDEKEMIAATDAVLDFYLTLGDYADKFEQAFCDFQKTKHTIVANSGSSANLLAVSALMSQELKNRLNPGDEVITPASTFPTTFNPIIQNNLLPVLVDVDVETLNINPEKLKAALSKKTRAIMLPHTLGIPNEMDKVMDFAEKNNLFVIEDTCDALGSKFNGKLVGTFGDMGTYSFYPAHMITTGEGGAVTTDDEQLARIVGSIRDWGRACFCKRGEKNPLGACNNRFGFKINNIPYDHRYMYTHIGYNLKPTDIQCAIGFEQLKKLPVFIEKRKKNYEKLRRIFSKYDSFILAQPPEKAEVSWWAFPITVKEGAGFTRKDIVEFLEKNNIQTRTIFAGHILYQPGYRNVKCRISGKLDNTERIARGTFFIGLYPGIGDEELGYMEQKLKEFMDKR